MKNLASEHQETMPSEWYFENRFLEVEKRDIFLKEWQLIGSRSRIKNPGDVLVSEVANNPIVVVCQQQYCLEQKTFNDSIWNLYGSLLCFFHAILGKYDS